MAECVWIGTRGEGMMMASADGIGKGAFRTVAVAAGPTLGAVLWFMFHPQHGGWGSFTEPAAGTIGLLGWMALWWASQCVDLAVTSLLPVVVLPMIGAGKGSAILAPYANELIFLFAGGCVLSLALERHGIAARLLRSVIAIVGSSPQGLTLGFLVVSALVSAVVSNTATVAMLLPMVLATIHAVERGNSSMPTTALPLRNFRSAVMLSIAYGASIGGVMTVLGSPPNPIAAEWINRYSQEHPGTKGMDFVRWLTFGVPVALVTLVAAFLVLRANLPLRELAPAALDEPSARRGSISRGGWATLAVFVIALVGWIGVPLARSAGVPMPPLTDGSVAVLAAILLLALPEPGAGGVRIVPIQMLGQLPWGVFILFGGGLCLADAMDRTGVSQSIAQSASSLGALPPWAILFLLVATLLIASEVASNTALTATAVPIVGPLAVGLGMPADQMVVAAALAASLAFALPVGTAPNAMVFSTGKLPAEHMMRVGLQLNACAMIIITLACLLLF
ncbi:MAG: DASS family sodium-coupled anion symporter [Planctomycetes bacterium]|nr:DASS family sodium-coupled anion symporter [Planctomycetota bacterium]